MDFIITISSIDPKFTELLQAAFDNCSYIKIYNGPFNKCEFDCIVSPGNSYGMMDGGIDMEITKYFGDKKEFIKLVQSQLNDQCNLQQQPGSVCVINTSNEKCPYLFHCPTMMTPITIKDYSVIYWCFYNILNTAFNHNMNNQSSKIKNIVMSGLGTGCGRVSYNNFIKLIKLAHQHFVSNLSRDSTTWPQAQRNYIELYKVIESLDSTPEDDMSDIMRLRRLLIDYEYGNI